MHWLTGRRLHQTLVLLTLTLAAAFLASGCVRQSSATPVEPTQAVTKEVFLPTAISPEPTAPPAVTQAPTETELPQVIDIASPAPGTLVGSPVVLTGQTNRFPLAGKLNYRILTANGTALTTGAFNIVGTPGRPTTFDASIVFAVPRGGGSLTIELFDQNAATGVIVASTSIELLYWSP